MTIIICYQSISNNKIPSHTNIYNFSLKMSSFFFLFLYCVGEANATNRINVPASVFEDIVADEVALVFGFYSTSVLFPLRINQTVTENSTHKAIGTSVIAASIVVGQDIDKLEDPVIITLEVTSQVCQKHIIVLT